MSSANKNTQIQKMRLFCFPLAFFPLISHIWLASAISPSTVSQICSCFFVQPESFPLLCRWNSTYSSSNLGLLRIVFSHLFALTLCHVEFSSYKFFLNSRHRALKAIITLCYCYWFSYPALSDPELPEGRRIVLGNVLGTQ